MHRSSTFFIIFVLFVALLPACAKKEMIKPTQEASPAAASPERREQPATSPREASPEAVKESVIREVTDETDGKAGIAETDRRLETVYFDFDSHLLGASARDVLYRNSRWMAANPAAKVRIEGHCDERGSGEYNLALGEKRAKATMQYLLTLGIAPARLSFISYGEESPASPGHDEEAWRKNRRAEFVVSVE